jgi:hypothetical protein
MIVSYIPSVARGPIMHNPNLAKPVLSLRWPPRPKSETREAEQAAQAVTKRQPAQPSSPAAPPPSEAEALPWV